MDNLMELYYNSNVLQFLFAVLGFLFTMLLSLVFAMLLYAGMVFIYHFLKDDLPKDLNDLISVPPQLHHVVGVFFLTSLIAAGLLHWNKFFNSSFIDVLIMYGSLTFIILMGVSFLIDKLRNRKSPK